eukprot:CAMPEP_0170849534 /NCGR_PEP_ID=MMETSP0734-20130129/10067_1 /TAXON_ID=186038 /ORGANISM="Fragilariopsis kerguelensis, Strain L26-C5" /LENGTH=149 /DNA_ID=CAMNT_0011219225 /DNA_START=60 /DNA_END=509 /DNA_ORIENTATION=+
MTEHKTNLPFAIDATFAPPLTIRSSPTTNNETIDLLSIDSSDSSSDSVNITTSSEFSSSSSSIKKQKQYHQQQQQHQHHSNRNNGFLFCGSNENGGFITATPKQLRTEIIDNNPIHYSTRRSIIEFNFNDGSTNSTGYGIPERLMVPVI